MWLFCVSVLSVVMLLCSAYPSKGSRCSVSANGDPHKILNPKSWWMLNRNALCFEDEPLSLTVNRLVVKYVCYSQRAQQLTITFIKCLSLSIEKFYFVCYLIILIYHFNIVYKMLQKVKTKQDRKTKHQHFWFETLSIAWVFDADN